VITQKEIEAACDVLRPVGELVAALRALAALLEQEPYLEGVERQAIIRAVFAAATSDDVEYYRGYHRPQTVGEKLKEEDSRRNGEKIVRTHRRRDYLLRYNYGITLEDFHALIVAQCFSCAICKRAFEPSTEGEGHKNYQPHLDHRHSDGKIRGVLCNNCNRGLGYFRDDPEIAQAAVEYLKKHI
jgi:hypothetical protein